MYYYSNNTNDIEDVYPLNLIIYNNIYLSLNCLQIYFY